MDIGGNRYLSVILFALLQVTCRFDNSFYFPVNAVMERAVLSTQMENNTEFQKIRCSSSQTGSIDTLGTIHPGHELVSCWTNDCSLYECGAS